MKNLSKKFASILLGLSACFILAQTTSAEIRPGLKHERIKVSSKRPISGDVI